MHNQCDSLVNTIQLARKAAQAAGRRPGATSTHHPGYLVLPFDRVDELGRLR